MGQPEPASCGLRTRLTESEPEQAERDAAQGIRPLGSAGLATSGTKPRHLA
jgi:hypothetical protein